MERNLDEENEKVHMQAAGMEAHKVVLIATKMFVKWFINISSVEK